jgi:hypothetical protein
MSNIFQEVLTDANGVQQKLLGPTYPYYQNIKTPAQIGMSDAGNLQTLGNDINGLIAYVEVLVSGNSPASATGGPLGNKFFLNTGAKCLDTSTNQQQDRYIYVNNVPTGNIPFISSAMGVNFTDFKGLIPGTISDLNVLNPYAIMQSFLSGSVPPCQQVTLQTIDNNNNSSTETHYVSTVDIQNMDPCVFQNGTNPINGKKCNETFANNSSVKINYPEDPYIQLFFICLALLGVFFLYKIMILKR